MVVGKTLNGLNYAVFGPLTELLIKDMNFCTKNVRAGSPLNPMQGRISNFFHGDDLHES